MNKLDKAILTQQCRQDEEFAICKLQEKIEGLLLNGELEEANGLQLVVDEIINRSSSDLRLLLIK